MVALIAGVLSLTPPAHAATITVTTMTDNEVNDADCSLREALVAANTDAPYFGCTAGSGIDTITVPSGTITLSSILTTVTADLILDGAGIANTTISGNDLYSILWSQAGSITLEDLTLTKADNAGFPYALLATGDVAIERVSFNDNGGQALLVGPGNLTMTDSSITNHRYGTAIQTSGNVEIADSTFTNNRIRASVLYAVEDTTITGSTFSGTTDGSFAGAISQIGDSLQVTDSTFTNNFGREAGAVALHSDATGHFDGVTFSGNQSGSADGHTASAGAIVLRSNDASATVSDSTFTSNSSGGVGGAIGICPSCTPAGLTVTDSTFTGNTAASHGGAIYSRNPVTVTGSTFTDNAAAGDGGAIYNESTLDVSASDFDGNIGRSGGGVYAFDANVTVSGSNFDGNDSGLDGGAIAAEESDVDIDDSIFTNNNALLGGGGAVAACLCAPVGDLTIEDSILTGNTSFLDGGAIASGAATSIVRSTISGNESTDWSGGGIALYGDGGADPSFAHSIESSTVSGNTSSLGGGGLFVYDSFGIPVTLDVANSTFSGNEVVVGGERGTQMYLDADATLTHVTIDGVASNAGAGAIYNSIGITDLRNSVVSGDYPGTIPECELATAAFSSTVATDASCGDIVGDPVLSSLTNNGGPTQTMAIASNSPAFNAADNAFCLPTDQRGQNRPLAGVCDAGAYELYVPPPPARHLLKVVIVGQGTVTGTGDLDIDCPDDCTSDLLEWRAGELTAMPLQGWEFESWTGDCVSVTNNICSVEMSTRRTVTATFTEIEEPPPPPPPPVPVVEFGRCKGFEHGTVTVLPDGGLMVVGTVDADVLSGSTGADIICGLAGDDTIRGGKGNDTLGGGAGDDRISGQHGDDTINGHAGIDTCFGGNGSNKLRNCESSTSMARTVSPTSTSPVRAFE